MINILHYPKDPKLREGMVYSLVCVYERFITSTVWTDSGFRICKGFRV